MLFVTSHISGHRRTWVLVQSETSHKYDSKLESNEQKPVAYTVSDILQALLEREGTCCDICLSYRGKPVNPTDTFKKDDNLIATLKLNGGKGGFGSMLRAIGAQIEKTTNREACRDLSGRRLRDINEEKRLKEYLSKKVEKEKELHELKKKKLAKLKDGSKHIFEDKNYFEQREKREKDIFDSIDKAFTGKEDDEQMSKPSTSSAVKPLQKLKKTTLMDDLDESSDEEWESESEQNGNEKFGELSKDGKNEERKSDEKIGDENFGGIVDDGNGERRKLDEAVEKESDKDVIKEQREKRKMDKLAEESENDLNSEEKVKKIKTVLNG